MVTKVETSSGAIEISGPHIAADDASVEFFEAADKGVLALKWCSSCEKWSAPTVDVCAHCHEQRPRWRESAGTGELVTWAVLHSPPHPAFVDDMPIVSAIVELIEGPWINLRMVGPMPHLRAGMPVDIAFARSDGSVSYPVGILQSNTEVMV